MDRKSYRFAFFKVELYLPNVPVSKYAVASVNSILNILYLKGDRNVI